MKKLMLLSVLLFSTSSAFATKARMRALNQGTNGSYFLMDTRNIFLNPAQVSMMKDHVNFEWGQRERTGIVDANAEAEGGFVTSMGAGKIGAQLGRVTDFNQRIRAVNLAMSDIPARVTGTAGSTFAEGQNNVDIFYGGGGDLRWGGSVGFTRSKTPAAAGGLESEVQGYELRGGVYTDAFEAYGGLLLGAKTETDLGAGVSAQLDEQLGIIAGVGANFGSDKKAYANFRMDNFDAERSNGTVELDGRALELLVGFANWRNLDNNARFFYALDLNFISIDAEDKKTTNIDEEMEIFALPITIGIEADGNSWLRIRGSVSQNFLLGTTKTTTGNTANDDNKWENAPNSTSVAGGVGASLNKFNLDIALVQAVGDDHGRAEGSLTYMF